MQTHVNKVCRNASLALRKIGSIRPYLDKSSTEVLVHAFVSSLLDNCNSLLVGLPVKQVTKLQRIQNSAARLVSKSPRKEHTTPILKELHWLPIKFRIRFKILLLVFNAIHGLAPSYLSDLLSIYTPARSLRSSNQQFLHVPPQKTKNYGERSFSFIGPTFWNLLPYEIRTQSNPNIFKEQLKTYLFKKAYL